jgi:uncharacterized protein YchJ
MSYSCCVESAILSAPCLEPLIAETVEDARAEAEALLRSRAGGYAAHVIRDGKRVATVRHAPSASHTSARAPGRSGARLGPPPDSRGSRDQSPTA